MFPSAHNNICYIKYIKTIYYQIYALLDQHYKSDYEHICAELARAHNTNFMLDLCCYAGFTSAVGGQMTCDKAC